MFCCSSTLLQAKDGNLLEDNRGESDLFEKIRRLAAGGKGWDKKIKRKRSVGTFITRPVDSDEVPKRAFQKKVADEHFRCYLVFIFLTGLFSIYFIFKRKCKIQSQKTKLC